MVTSSHPAHHCFPKPSCLSVNKTFCPPTILVSSKDLNIALKSIKRERERERERERTVNSGETKAKMTKVENARKTERRGVMRNEGNVEN